MSRFCFKEVDEGRFYLSLTAAAGGDLGSSRCRRGGGRVAPPGVRITDVQDRIGTRLGRWPEVRRPIQSPEVCIFFTHLFVNSNGWVW